MAPTIFLPSRTIRIGSRKSELALVQSYWVQKQLQKHFPNATFEVEKLSTKGDKILDVALSKIGDKALFTKELELAMLNKEIDFAVHSLKDLPTRLPKGLTLATVTERENPADALVVNQKYKDRQIDTLPAGTVIGTSSLRRLAQLRYLYPHLAFKDIRGNLNTRLAKLDNGEYDALILAVAGLKRLGMDNRVHQVLPPEVSLHAVGQGALAIECRTEDREILALLKSIEHSPTRTCVTAERAFLRELEGGCQVPIGVNTQLDENTLVLTGFVASVDGKRMLKDTVIGNSNEPEMVGIELANNLRQMGAQEILSEIYHTHRQ
jgi:hydroxymethylbilane synthase